MFVVRNYVTMCGTVACALAIGYLMQNGSALRPAQEHSSGMSVKANQASVLASLDDIVLTSSPTSDTDTTTLPGLDATPSRVQPGTSLDCKLSARAFAAPDANVRLFLKAPCHKQDRIEIHHNGLTFAALTDDQGRLNLTVPALSEYAIFLFSIDEQNGTVATTHVPEIAAFERIALQWRGDTDLQLHALEFGASYGEDGHVWSGTTTSGQGTVIHLGQPDVAQTRNVEIYSFPTLSSAQSGTIELSVEAEVTDANCGQELDLQSLELRGGQRLRSRDLSVTLPDCTGADNFLVLNNLFEDLTIAAR